jgi:hypothetical protein
MRIGQIVLRLRLKNTYFGNYIGGALELDKAIANTLTNSMAFVIPLMDDAEGNKLDSGISQKIIERFGVVIALAMDESQSDTLGFAAMDRLHDIRNEFISALVGWMPLDSEDQISYRGGRLLETNNAYMWYQFEFDYISQISQTKNSSGMMVAEISKTNFDDTQIPVDFNTIYMQLINTPDYRIPYIDKFGNPGELPYPDGFPDVKLPDMANWIDLTKDPRSGAFFKSFHSGFNVDRKE